MVLFVSGRTPMRRVVDGIEEVREVGPGDISLYPSSVPTWTSWQRPVEILSVAIDPAHLADIAREFVGGPSTLRMRHGLRVNDDKLGRLARELLDELRPPRAFASELAARALGERLAVHLLRSHFDIGPLEEKGRCFSLAESDELQAWVDDHLGTALRVEDVAEHMHLGVQQVMRAFRRTFSRTPHQWIRERRLQRACTLLLTSDIGISSIAMDTGFADQSHLTRCFTEHFGEPPAAHRRRHQKGHS